jgi:hypothetical protein
MKEEEREEEGRRRGGRRGVTYNVMVATNNGVFRECRSVN